MDYYKAFSSDFQPVNAPELPDLESVLSEREAAKARVREKRIKRAQEKFRS